MTAFEKEEREGKIKRIKGERKKKERAEEKKFFVCLFGWFLNVLVNHYVISRTGHKTERVTILRAAGHIILTPSQSVGSWRPQRELNPGPPHQESRALATELPRPRGNKEKQREGEGQRDIDRK